MVGTPITFPRPSVLNPSGNISAFDADRSFSSTTIGAKNACTGLGTSTESRLRFDENAIHFPSGESLITFRHYQRKLMIFTKQLRERGADLGSLFVDTLLGMRTVVTSNAGDREA